MRLQVIVVHDVPKEEGGGLWAEVPALPGCMTQGDTREELEANVKEAVLGWFKAGEAAHKRKEDEEVVEIAV